MSSEPVSTAAILRGSPVISSCGPGWLADFYSVRMADVETAEMIGRTRTVSAQALLEGRADLGGYPFYLLAVVSQRGVGVERVGYLVAAAEMLMQYGWDLVNVAEFGGSNVTCAFMRRRPPV